MTTTSLTDLASEVSWVPYSSKVTPINLAKNMARDQRIYLLLKISPKGEEYQAFNKAGKKVGILSQEEGREFEESFASFKINTEAPVYSPEDKNVYGIGYFYDSGVSK